MSVKAIRLENFMAFADTGWIELRPITLLFGRNSSGKSAIIRALRLLRQNILNPTKDRYTLRFNDEYGVTLGDYEETIHLKDTEQGNAVSLSM
jgi:AAA15 family ATPase/GTPase